MRASKSVAPSRRAAAGPRRKKPRRAASAAPTTKRKSSDAGQRWSAGVMRRSDALDLQAGVFKQGSARAIARSLKRSSESSHRRKGTPFQSAMSMLNFEINRAGVNLSARRKRVLEAAKNELRKAFDRPTV